MLQSDNRGEFTAQATKDCIRKYGGNQVFGSRYHPQSQGYVERVNCTIKRLLAKVCFPFTIYFINKKIFINFILILRN